MDDTQGAAASRTSSAGRDRASDDYLIRLGARVRATRARRGMSRRILAHDSGLSERFLAQLEAGQANISITRLRHLAEAMSQPLIELLREGPDRALEVTLAVRLLERLSPAQQAEAHQLLVQRFALDASGRRHIALIGLRGAGKSTIGNALAKSLQIPFHEMAEAIARQSGMRLDEVFETYGQGAYRRYERRALEHILETVPHAVIATGGSLPSEPETYDLLLKRCFTVWLKATPEEHMARVVAQGDFRPMKGNREAMADLKRILAGRDALYRKADAVIDTSGRPMAATLAEIEAVCRAAGVVDPDSVNGK